MIDKQPNSYAYFHHFRRRPRQPRPIDNDVDRPNIMRFRNTFCTIGVCYQLQRRRSDVPLCNGSFGDCCDLLPKRIHSKMGRWRMLLDSLE
ncbi:hypothetical protein CFRS1_v000222 [Colletotrichum fructicola]|nr:hypothetical protein CFRS1_v000222 [Colletotrichum fructicola]